MGCSNCGTSKGGKPTGCKSNGGCSTGGCNRMNVYDWLSNLPLTEADGGCRIIEVSFNKGSRKEFYRNATTQVFERGDCVSVEGVSGFDVGEVSMTGELVRLQLKKKGVEERNPDFKKVLRRASDRDLEVMQQNKAREKEALVKSRAIARKLKLEMKMSEVEIQADGRKATFFYIADDRVDFRELIKVYAGEFRLKVEMRQIGARQEAAKVGGVGSCGRELCCATWLTDFKSVNTTAARYQNLSINQSKLSGQCGRLKCCLNYELDTYLDALQNFPENADSLQVAKGTASLVKKDIFKNLMWYVLPDSNKQYPLTIERVRKIRQMNLQNQVPDTLDPIEVSTGKPKEVESPYVDLVGQISLKTLEKADRKKKHGHHKHQAQHGAGRGRGGENSGRGGENGGKPEGGGGNRGGRDSRGGNQGGGNERGGNQGGGNQGGGGNPGQRGSGNPGNREAKKTGAPPPEKKS
ncbi:MAG TPA: regulatory iron-sulfur-containing complex subunit RicT [Puia sp.]|uniref:PSP1 domain-containing protein n=1 Tax=Puia sp. TaxID=2045100 RepID=UPI002CD2FE0A|nr:regulatory iron-sulfur-containing complex subunit RicT [Puia sp.]HVU97488.1 regulatory iron-sulfur-containing complex subunit RicT [Puia sp.]